MCLVYRNPFLDADTISADVQSSGSSGVEGFISPDLHCERRYPSDSTGLRWVSSGYLIFRAEVRGDLLRVAGIISNSK